MGLQLGRYELVEPLARGGMAEVFLARRRGPGGVEKQLVVKRIAREKSRDPRFAEMFVTEARLSMSLAHRNIVPVFDFGRAGDELFLVMEYVDGIDLGQALKRSRFLGKKMSPVLLAFVGLEAAQGLDYAHTSGEGPEGGVIHRDVTPGNILVSTAGEVKLVDFGVASLAGDEFGDRKVRGTPSYMSPEQARAKRVDGRSDLFSLGMILWEAAAGERGYQGETAEDILDAARACELSELPASVPEELRVIIDKATAAKPGDRYQSARELVRALDRFLVGARARDDEDAQPPTSQLATWVAEVRPTRHPHRTLPEMAAPQGEVVTYLAAGPEKIATIAGDPGDATARSLAATVDDIDAPDEDSQDGGRESSAPSRRTVAYLTAISALLGGMLLAAVLTLGGGNDRAEAEVSDAAVVAAGPNRDAAGAAIVDAQPRVDAATSLADAGLPAASLPDARAARVRVDAGSERTGADAATTELGTVRISTSPWARVSVTGRSEGCKETPCQLRLPAGTHELLLDNPVSRVSARVEVQVEAGKTATVRKGLTR